MNAAQAKTIKIADYLHSLGYSPAKIQGYNYWYRSPYREERTASFKVDTNKNTWHDFGTGEGGDIIDLAQKIGNCSVEIALHSLVDLCAYRQTGSNANMQTDNSSFFQSKNVLPENNPTTTILNILPITHPKLIEYVNERKIPLDLVNLYCKEIHYQNQSGNHFSVGFRNDKGGHELNSPNNFKGCIAPKEITTIQNNSDTCLVFEGFWDLLSYLTIQKIEKTKHDVAVLNSTANTEKAMNFLKTHKEIYTYLDNDESGRKATELIKFANLTVYNRSSQFAGYKDLNDYLCGKKLLLKKQVRKGFRL
jgi:DNA primase